MALYDTDDEQEKVVLVGVELNPLDDCEKSLEELAELAKTAGAVTVGKMIQPRDSFHPTTAYHTLSTPIPSTLAHTHNVRNLKIHILVASTAIVIMVCPQP